MNDAGRLVGSYHDSAKRVKKSYKEKMKLISLYFNIPNDASIYLYHRRRRSFPFKKKTMQNYLEWNLAIQNGLVKIMGENQHIDWSSRDFNDEENLLTKYNIDTSVKTSVVYKNKPKNIVADANCIDEKILHDIDGWVLVTDKRRNASNKFLLRKIGLLPLSKESMKTNRQKRAIHNNKSLEQQIEKKSNT